MRHAATFVKEIRREDFWIIPFTVMALILAGYAAMSSKPVIWWFSGVMIVGMFIFTAVIIAIKYNRLRSFLHIAIGTILLMVAARIGLSVW